MKSGKGSRAAQIQANAQANAAAAQQAALQKQLAAQKAADAKTLASLNKPIEVPEIELPETEVAALPTEVDQKVSMAAKRAKARRTQRETPVQSRGTVLATRAGTRNLGQRKS